MPPPPRSLRLLVVTVLAPFFAAACGAPRPESPPIGKDAPDPNEPLSCLKELSTCALANAVGHTPGGGIEHVPPAPTSPGSAELRCCSGTVCSVHTIYDHPRCLRPLLTGAFCNFDEECGSGECILRGGPFGGSPGCR